MTLIDIINWILEGCGRTIEKDWLFIVSSGRVDASAHRCL